MSCVPAHLSGTRAVGLVIAVCLLAQQQYLDLGQVGPAISKLHIVLPQAAVGDACPPYGSTNHLLGTVRPLRREPACELYTR